MKANPIINAQLADDLEDITAFTASLTPSEFSAIEHDDLVNTSTQGCHHTKGKMKPQLNPHPTYFFEDGNLYIRVDQVDFKIHRYFFMRDSVPFRQISKNGIIGRTVASGIDDDLDEVRMGAPLVLENISSEDFEHFLSVLYPKYFGRDGGSTYSYWSSVLRVSDYLGFASIRSLSIEKLSTVATSIEKIEIGRKFKVNYWLRDAYHDVCTRPKSLTKEEGRMLGVDEVVAIMEARQIFLWENLHMGVKEKDAVLNRLFGLQEDSWPVPVPVPVPVPDDDHSAKPSHGASESDERESPSQPQLEKEPPASAPAVVNSNSSSSSQEPVIATQPSLNQGSQKESPPTSTVSSDSETNDHIPASVVDVDQQTHQETVEAKANSPDQSLEQRSLGRGDPPSSLPEPEEEEPIPNIDPEIEAIQSRLVKVLDLRRKLANLDQRLYELKKQLDAGPRKYWPWEWVRIVEETERVRRLRDEQLIHTKSFFKDVEVWDEPPSVADLSECGMSAPWLPLVVDALEQLLYPGKHQERGTLTIRLSRRPNTSRHQKASLDRLFKAPPIKYFDTGDGYITIVLPNAES